MGEFFVARFLERGDLHSLRVDAVEDLANGAVLAARIGRLENHQDPPLSLGVEDLLKRFQPLVELGVSSAPRLLAAFEPSNVARIDRVEVYLGAGLYTKEFWIEHAATVDETDRGPRHGPLDARFLLR